MSRVHLESNRFTSVVLSLALGLCTLAAGCNSAFKASEHRQVASNADKALEVLEPLWTAMHRSEPWEGLSVQEKFLQLSPRDMKLVVDTISAAYWTPAEGVPEFPKGILRGALTLFGTDSAYYELSRIVLYERDADLIDLCLTAMACRRDTCLLPVLVSVHERGDLPPLYRHRAKALAVTQTDPIVIGELMESINREDDTEAHLTYKQRRALYQRAEKAYVDRAYKWAKERLQDPSTRARLKATLRERGHIVPDLVPEPYSEPSPAVGEILRQLRQVREKEAS